MTLSDLIPGAGAAKVIGIAVAAAVLFGAGWYVNGERLTSGFDKQELKDQQARALKLEADLKLAADALREATTTIKGATNAYETARAALDEYRNSIGNRYAGIRLCRQPDAAGQLPATPAPAGPGGDHGPGNGAVLPDSTGPDLASLAADAEGLRGRAQLCRAYALAVEQWAARLNQPKR
jgi:hypothetical protein